MPVDMHTVFGRFGRGAALLSAIAGLCAGGQTHKVAKPEQVVRAVGVYEWTGDIAKPTANRLIPVTVFIDGQLEDAGVYLSRPVPFALLTGNFYELQQAGIPKGGVELRYAKHLLAVDTATGANEFDNGWFGYGVYRAPAAPKKAPALVASKNVSQIKSSKDDDSKPHFSNSGSPSKGDADSGTSGTTAASNAGSASNDSGSVTTSAGDPDRPTMRRRTGNGSDSGGGSGSGSSKSPASSTGSTSADTSVPADDPDRPKLSKRSGSGSDTDNGSTDTTGTASSGGAQGQSGSSDSGSGNSKTTTTASGGSSDDADRPTLKRRSPEETKKQNQKEASASVTGIGSLNNDPDRPVMQRGKPASAMGESDLPKLTGLPADLHQMVAVSDAVNREPHDFTRAWDDDAERVAVLEKMQALARAKIADYVTSTSGSAATMAPAKPAPKPTTSSTAAARRKSVAAPPPAPVELQEETLKGFTLSYGGAPTYVYSAHTPGAGASLDYVTVVAQADIQGELKPAITSVTDAAHLDRTPRMRLVDVVDVEASNRASLLFELRGEKSRQFSLYRVIGARADQTFTTGSTE